MCRQIHLSRRSSQNTAKKTVPLHGIEFLGAELMYLFYVQLHTHEVVEVCAKILYQVELKRTTLDHMWGFSVEAELIENAERQDELCCYVSRVEDKSVGMQYGKI